MTLFLPQKLMIGIISLIVTSPAPVASVYYQTTALTGGRWQQSYIIVNDNLPNTTIQLVDFFFDRSLYQNITPVDLRNGWIDAGGNGFLNFDTGVEYGVALGGISIQFDYLGSGVPGSHPYQFTLPFDNFDVLEAGHTQPYSPVALPGSALFLSSGLLLLINMTSNIKRLCRNCFVGFKAVFN